MAQSNGTQTGSSSDVQNVMGVAALILVVAAAMIGHFATEKPAQILADVTMIFGTFYVSFLVSRHFARVTSRKEMQDLAEASGTRIFLLSSQMRDLAQDVYNYDPDGPTSKIYYEVVGTQLTRLASQAELSFEDLQRIARVNISIPKLREEAVTRVEEGAQREKINCPECQNQVEVLMPRAAGASKHCRCDKCRKVFICHRLPDGIIKMSYSDDIEIDCPNSSCSNRIRIRRGPTDWGTTIRNCYECYARVQFNFDTKKVDKFDIEEPQVLEASKIIGGQAECPYCAWTVSFRDTRNSRGEWLQFCPNCTKLIRVKEVEQEDGQGR